MLSSSTLGRTNRLKSLSYLLLFGGLIRALLVPDPTQAATVSSVDFLGQATFPTETQFAGTQVGGLSGITYDSANEVYYSVSDDRSQINPARFYTLNIDLSQGSLASNGVTFTGVTTLKNAAGQLFAANSLDPEGIALASAGTLFVSSEGEAEPAAGRITSPFVNQFSLTGNQLSALPVAGKFLPVPTESGVRNNLAFESLTITPDQKSLFTATENALVQDGPAAGLTNPSLSRIIQYDLQTNQAIAEFVYRTDPTALPPNPSGGFSTSGLVDLLALDSGNLLALERSFSVGAAGTPGNTGHTVKLYQVSLAGETNVSGIDSLGTLDINGISLARKTLILDFTDLNIPISNLEGLTLGPALPDGRRSLVVVSDNNFNPAQFTQVLAFGVNEAPTAVPEPASSAAILMAGALGIRLLLKKVKAA